MNFTSVDFQAKFWSWCQILCVFVGSLGCFCVITFGHVCFWPGAFTSLDWDCQTRKLSFQGLFRLVKSDYLPHCLTTKAAQSYICLPKTSIFVEEMCSWSEKKKWWWFRICLVCLFVFCLVVWLFVSLFFCLYYVHLCSIPICERSPNSLMLFHRDWMVTILNSRSIHHSNRYAHIPVIPPRKSQIFVSCLMVWIVPLVWLAPTKNQPLATFESLVGMAYIELPTIPRNNQLWKPQTPISDFSGFFCEWLMLYWYPYHPCMI